MKRLIAYALIFSLAGCARPTKRCVTWEYQPPQPDIKYDSNCVEHPENTTPYCNFERQKYRENQGGYISREIEVEDTSPQWYDYILFPIFVLASVGGSAASMQSSVVSSPHYQAGMAGYTDYTKPENQPR